MKKTFFLIGLMCVFAIIFFLAFIAYKTGFGLLNIMPVKYEGAVIMVFSVIGIIKTVRELI